MPPFDASLFVTFRKHLNLDVINPITEKIIAIKTKQEQKKSEPKDDSDSASNDENPNRGSHLMD